MTLTIPQPEGTTHWKVELQMDQNVQELHVRTSDASMTVHNEDSVILLLPLADHNFKTNQTEISVEYFFDDREDIANEQGEIPRWRMPCVRQVTSCQFKVCR